MAKREVKFPGGAKGAAYHEEQRRRMRVRAQPILDHLTGHGWSTIEDISATLGKNYITTYFLLRQLVRAGEVSKVHVKTGRRFQFCLKGREQEPNGSIEGIMREAHSDAL